MIYLIKNCWTDYKIAVTHLETERVVQIDVREVNFYNITLLRGI